MRKIYYVPEGQDILDYQDIWLNHTQEVHNSLSENIKEYVNDKDVAQWVLIPEYTYSEVPKLINNEEFYRYLFIDDFAVLEDNPQYVMEAWKLNLTILKKNQTCMKLIICNGKKFYINFTQIIFNYLEVGIN